MNHHLTNASPPCAPVADLAHLRDVASLAALVAQVVPASAAAFSDVRNAPAESRMPRLFAALPAVQLHFFLSPAELQANPLNARTALFYFAHMFRLYPALSSAAPEDTMAAAKFVDAEGNREERVYCNWMASLGVPVRNITSDLGDGIALLRVFDHIVPNSVKWSKVNVPANSPFQRAENCNYVITVAIHLKLEIRSIGGSDIQEGNRKLILAILWQAMRLHVFIVLERLSQVRAAHCLSQHTTVATQNPTVMHSRANVRPSAPGPWSDLGRRRPPELGQRARARGGPAARDGEVLQGAGAVHVIIPHRLALCAETARHTVGTGHLGALTCVCLTKDTDGRRHRHKQHSTAQAQSIPADVSLPV